VHQVVQRDTSCKIFCLRRWMTYLRPTACGAAGITSCYFGAGLTCSTFGMEQR
jgi:hypothetical protein